LAALIVALVNGISQGGNQSKSVGFITVGFLVALLIGCNLRYGFSVGILRFHHNSEETIKEMISAGFKEDYGRVLGIVLLKTVFIILWTLLLIIPGIIKALSYSMTPFILQDDPTISGNAAIEKSMRMMDGHKMDLFWLFLSFIGWIILSIMTFGIGFILLEPYINTSVAHFYEDLKKQQGE
jgi:uncharacterized membrane protein